jgi:hypothetical protein
MRLLSCFLSAVAVEPVGARWWQLAGALAEAWPQITTCSSSQILLGHLLPACFFS